MLKGHTKIELTNVHTGEKEVVEKHNLITDNLSNIANFFLKHIGDLSLLVAELYPLYEKFMGGIVLFSDPIEENAKTVLLPSTSADTITGYASNGTNDGSDTKKGSRNLTESMKLDNGFKYVWDFGTSQANGNISTIALCDSGVCDKNPASFYPRNAVSIKVYDSLYVEYIKWGLVHYDFDNDIATCIITTSSANVSVKKFSLCTNTMHFIDSPYTVKAIGENTITSSIELPVGGKWSNGYDGYYYYYKNDGSQQMVARMNASTMKIDTSFGLKTFACGAYGEQFCISNGYLYVSSASSIDEKNILKVNLSNVDDIVGVARIAYGFPIYSVNGIVYYYYMAIFKDDTFIETESLDTNVSNIYISDSGKYISTSNDRSYIYMGYLKNNLNTINNLETPVTKTADKTMKITYTITEE